MLSRVADAVFWMARYMERTNGLLRILRTNYISSQDEVRNFSWEPLMRYFSELPGDTDMAATHDSAAMLEYFVLNRDNAASVYNNITRARENARAVQDHITKEVWQCLNNYYHIIREPRLSEQIELGDPVTVLDNLVSQGLLYHGTVDITMARGEGYSYLNLGKYTERALLSLDMLHIKLLELDYQLSEGTEVPALRYLLYSLSGYELYLKTHRGNFQINKVLEHILYNEQFPHSITYCLKQLMRYAERIEGESLPESFKQLEFSIGRAMSKLRYHALDPENGEALRNFLHEIRQDIVLITQMLNRYYFGNS